MDGHENYYSNEFEQYCKDNNIITLCMPTHLSHLLQLLDVGCFGPLKMMYDAKIEHLIQARITHIIKKDFFLVFQKVFNATITVLNIKRNFKKVRFIPMNPQNVISKLDVKLAILQSLRLFFREVDSWVSKMLQKPIEVSLQSEYIKN